MTPESDQGILRGQCECGTVRYTVADEFRYAGNCHCSRCRAAIFVGSKAPRFEITDDLPQFEEYPT